MVEENFEQSETITNIDIELDSEENQCFIFSNIQEYSVTGHLNIVDSEYRLRFNPGSARKNK